MPHFMDLSNGQKLAIGRGLQRAEYFLLTGAGASLDSLGSNGELMKSASSLAKELRKINELPESTSLQQAYKLLNADQIEQTITVPYTCSVPGPTNKKIIQVPWKRIFTFNVDDCLECIVENKVNEFAFAIDSLQTIDFSDNYCDRNVDNIYSIIHLHGSVRNRNYVFSHTEYAKSLTRINPWMSNLTQFMAGEPFVVAGTTLEEIDVEFYLQHRQPKSAISDPELPSILIEPYPNKLTYRLCEDHGFYLFEGTTLDFFTHIESVCGPLSDTILSSNIHSILPPSVPIKLQRRFSETFERPPSQPLRPAANASFLLGAPLTWEMVQQNGDIARTKISAIDNQIAACLQDRIQFLLILDDPASGRTSLAKRLAFRHAKIELYTFYYRGVERINDEDCANILGNLPGNCVIFVDDFADSSSFFTGMMYDLMDKNVLVVGFARKYRRNYIEDSLAEFDYAIIDSQLDLDIREARQLLLRSDSLGISDQPHNSTGIDPRVNQIIGQPISIANCRIQNDFEPFDKIVASIVADCDRPEIKLYAATALAHRCHPGGVPSSVLNAMHEVSSSSAIGDLHAKLPIARSPDISGFVVPARSAMAERVLSVLKTSNSSLLSECIIEMSNIISSRVNRDAIRQRTPEAKLAAGLMDFDRTIKIFCNDDANFIYSQIEGNWGWNSRYWEQLSLMKLDRFFASKDDLLILREAIQNAKFAYGIEKHPLSLTTLAKALFAALDAKVLNKEAIFSEGWNLIYEAIQIERNWKRVKAAAFIIALKGVNSFIRNGGIIDGDTSEQIREVIRISKERKVKGRIIDRIRDETGALIS